MEVKLKRLNIELTSNCNYACISCPTDKLIRGKGMIDSKLFERILDETGNSLERIFWGYGDPLLHPEIDKLVRYAGNFQAKKIMSTTGYMLENMGDVESLRHLDELILSINGITQETYVKHQVNGNLEKVIRGIKKLVPVITNSKTRLIMQTIAHKENLNELSGAEDFARDLGCDMLIIKSFNVMDKKQETFDKFVPADSSFSRYKHGLNESPKYSENKTYPCQEWMVINWDGSVNPCCWDYNGKHNWGNIKAEGVYKIWNGETASTHRNNIRTQKFLDICVDCTNNKLIKSYSFTNKAGEDVKKNI